MEKKSYTVAIDLGSSNVVVVVGSKQEDGSLSIEAVASKPVEGVNAGRIDNIEQAGNAIRGAIAEVEEKLGVRITEAYAGISGEFVRCARHTDHVFTFDPQNGVNQGDVDALFDRMRNVQAPDDETIMERIPQHYLVDEAEEVRNPVGSFCKRLSSTFNFILCAKTPLQRLDMALRRLGLRSLGVFANALATPEAVLTSDEKEEGVAVVNIGGGVTDVTVFYRGIPRYIATIPMGAKAINRDIRSQSIPEKHVESLKCKYGSAVADLAPDDKMIRVSGRTAREAKDILLRNLATVIEARAMDIVEFVMQELKDSGYIQKLAFGLVLTGGSARLKDIDELFHRTTGMDVRVGSAEGTLTDEARERLADPALATVAGILMRGAELAPCAVGERPRAERPAEPQPQPQPAAEGYAAGRPEPGRRSAFVPPVEPQRPEFRHVPPKAAAAPAAPQHEEPAAEEQPTHEPETVMTAGPQQQQVSTEVPESQPTKRPGLLERMKRTLKYSADVLNKKFEPGEDEEI